MLANNGIEISHADGAFSFTATEGDSYEVTVVSDPDDQTCVVANGSGTAGTEDINNVAVACNNNNFDVVVTVTGLQDTLRPQLQPRFAPRVTWSLWWGPAAKAWTPPEPG